MLHILLLILKIIGIILAVILGILVLLVCIVLFAPIRYNARVLCDGNLDSLEGEANIKWLFPLLVIKAQYKDRQIHYRVRAAWKCWSSEAQRKEEKRTAVAPKEDSPRAEQKIVSKSAVPYVTSSVEQKQTWEVPKKISEARERKEKAEKEKTPENRRDTFAQRLKKRWEKMKCTFASFYDKIKVLLEKKEKVLAFLSDEIHQMAFRKVKEVLFILLKRWCPKKIKADVIFGFEDPYRTGQMLAVLGVLYPFIGQGASITPDFERAIFKGNIYIKGKLTMIHVVTLLWKLFWCKAVRRTYKDIKNFKV